MLIFNIKYNIAYYVTFFIHSPYLFRTQAVLAGAIVMLKCLPDKLNPVVKPLMESIKREEDKELQVE